MSKSIFSILCFCMPLALYAQADSTVLVAKKKMDSGHQLRFSFDAAKLLTNALMTNNNSYEIAVDYYAQKELYYVAELGTGKSSVDYPDLKYSTSNTFLRLGLDKAMFVRKKPQDWGMGFVGFRYGFSAVQRSDATYNTNDGLGGITTGIVPSKNFSAHWAELTGGMRLELFKNTFAGWNVRFKFLLNQKSFGDLKPAYIAGYGLGDKATAFDFNFYLAYAIRWQSKK